MHTYVPPLPLPGRKVWTRGAQCRALRLTLAGTQITLLGTSEHQGPACILYAKVGRMSPGMQEDPQHPATLGTADKRKPVPST